MDKTTKICTICKRELPLSCFCKNKSISDGYHCTCKECKEKKDKVYRVKIKKENELRDYDNPPNITKKCSKCGETKLVKYFHIDRNRVGGYGVVCLICCNEISKARCDANRRQYEKKWREEHTEEIKAYKREYYQKHKERLYKKHRQYKKDNIIQLREKQNIHDRKRRKTDINFRIKQNLRGRIYKSIVNGYKSLTTEELLGCTIEEFKNFISMQFTEGMSWDNYGKGGWEIDHIIPCASFDLKKKSEQKKCFHYKNMQPLWEEDNVEKSDKILI